MITKTISGNKIALEKGQYLAGSPIGTTLVHIKNDNGEIVWEKRFENYDQRCKFISAFNNGTMSFQGRKW